MQRCYLGESFELAFRVNNRRDPSRTIDSGTFKVIDASGETVDKGTMNVDTEDGHIMRFRFIPQSAGMHRIVVTWRMGQDAWIQPHLMMVQEA